MVKQMTLQVIHLPRTVEALAALTKSLVDHSQFTVRLVTNGIEPSRVKLLRRWAELFERVEVFELPTERTLPHPTALNELFLATSDEHFIVCDHDILLSSQLAPEFVNSLADSAIVASGSRIENDPQSTYGGFSASARHFGDFELAAPFICAFRREAVERVMRDYRVGFNAYWTIEQIPAAVRHNFRQHGAFRLVDTGRALSVMCQIAGYKVRNIDHDNVLHLGGLSKSVPAFDKSIAEGKVISSTYVLEPLKYASDSGVILGRSAAEIRNRDTFSFFFAHLIHSIRTSSPRPTLSNSTARIDDLISGIARELERCFVDEWDFGRFCRRVGAFPAAQ
jgi:hypothetical protein